MNQVTAQQIASENQARAMVYNFLSSLFAKEINNDLVAQLTSVQGQSFLSSLALEPTLAPHINEINAKLTELNSEESLLELAADFCGLFLVSGKTSVSPYAGQYLSTEQNDTLKAGESQLFGELHQLMSEFLLNSNMQIHNDFPEPADHLAVMLAYLAHISLTASTESQLSFIQLYLMTWFDTFTQQVQKHDSGCFYAALAGLTLEWLKLEVTN